MGQRAAGLAAPGQRRLEVVVMGTVLAGWPEVAVLIVFAPRSVQVGGGRAVAKGGSLIELLPLLALCRGKRTPAFVCIPLKRMHKGV